jgi:3-O-methylgallate 3,4-dioxygenase
VDDGQSVHLNGHDLMAAIVLGLASSHTPQLSTVAEVWADHARRDQANLQLVGLDGEYHTYEEVLAVADPALEREMGRAVWEAKYQRCQAAIAQLAERLVRAEPDVVLVIGDDQEELFGPEGTPTFALYLGQALVDRPSSTDHLARMPVGLREAQWAAHASQPESYLSHPALSRHLAEALVADDFDVSVFSTQPEGRSLGHAFTYVRRRLALSASVPVIPVFINTYYPPNVPSPGRSYGFGRSLRSAIESWPEDLRVAIVASGGLSHFVVNEQLDRYVLDALGRSDQGAVRRIDGRHLRSGTSEILNWIAAGGALEGRKMEVVEYVPGYRSLAGTGTAMCFSIWS